MKIVLRTRTVFNINMERLAWVVMVLTLLMPATCLAGGRQQQLLEEPPDVNANLGDEVVLPCLVRDRAGPLQWTRNGFGLGLDTSLPGFPRYSLTPEMALKIEGITAADAGEYQCQVGAGPGDNPPLRSRSATLSVQVPPGPPKIFTSDGRALTDDDGGGGPTPTVEVTAGGTAVLECESEGGRPAANLAWTDAETGNGNVGYITTRTVRTSDNKVKTVSSLRLTANRRLHNRTLACSAANVASKGQPSVSRVRLDVKFAPELRGAGRLQENDAVVLHCQAEANPPPTRFGWYENGRPIAGESGEFLHIGRVTRGMHNTVIGCDASNAAGGAAERAVATLNVRYGPRMVAQPGPLATGRQGDRVELACQAESNPPPRYVWRRLGDAETGVDQAVGYSSRLELVVSRVTAGLYVCEAIVEGFEPARSATTRVAVLSRPRLLDGAGGEGGEVVGQLGGDAELVCRVKSVAKATNITWDYKGKQC